MIETFLERLRGLNVQLEVEGNRLRFRAPKGSLTDKDLMELTKHKTKILEHLRKSKAEVKTNGVARATNQVNWPPECLASEKRFGQPHSRLYPQIGKTVQTPKGRGRLWRVFTESIGVALNSDSEQVTFFEKAEHIYPLQKGSG